MKGYDEFISLFGEITVLEIAEAVFACVFMIFVYKKVRDYFIKKHEAEATKDEQIKEALEAAKKYPEYRQQCIQMQQLLEGQIQELRKMQEETAKGLEEMRAQTEKRERNKLRDLLLQNYRYYTGDKTNPNHSWTRMEAEAFWELFRDYEEAGGNGYMHTVVQPEMERLHIADVGGR